MTTRIFRQSEIKAWKLCRRHWHWAYQLGLDKERDEPDTSDVGTIVHGALQVHYEGGDALSYLEEAKPAELPTKAWEKTWRLAEVMVEGYLDWLETEGADAGYRVVSVERQLEVPWDREILGDTVIITGRLDLVVEHEPTGLLYLRDHKSVQSLDQAGRQLQVDDQLLTYAVLLRMLDGTRIAGAEHNMLKRVLRTATATPPFYGRAEVTFNDTHLRNHWRHMQGTLTEMVGAAQAIESDPEAHHFVAPPNPTKDCTWRCPFLDVCPMADDGSDIDSALRDLYVPRGEH